MSNEAYVSLIGFVATQPRKGQTKSGSTSLSMRVGWTPRALNQTTGEWTDLPSSFVTVYCYRKVAEHASVCLRRGEPIVVRGTIRVREYVDQNGQRRNTVEVQADSIGHDIGRGISTYSKLPVRTDMTADEYEQSVAAPTRSPLPGDLEQAAPEGAREPGASSGEDSQHSDDAPIGPAGAEAQLSVDEEVDEEYDEPMAGDEVAGTDDSLEPAGVLA